jgi:hypothetical protein
MVRTLFELSYGDDEFTEGNDIDEGLSNQPLSDPDD